MLCKENRAMSATFGAPDFSLSPKGADDDLEDEPLDEDLDDENE